LQLYDLKRQVKNENRRLSRWPFTFNHKNPATTVIYARLDPDPVRASMERTTAAGFKPSAEVAPIKASHQQQRKAG
jgi:hypothetical protein